MTLIDPLGLRRHAENALLGAVDHVLHLAIQRGLVQRVVEELLDDGVVDQVADRLLSGPELEQMVERVLASSELWLLVDEIARSPAVTEAISSQGAGFADQVVGQVGEGTRRADAWLERATRRMLHRTPTAPEPLVP